MSKRKLLGLTLAALLLTTILLSVSLIERALAQSGGSYDLSWWTVGSGGDTVSGGGYTLMGTAGQPDAGTPLTGGGYTLTGGFWPSEVSGGGQGVYLPIILKSY
jgi:hypothetical protein